jgi:integrase
VFTSRTGKYVEPRKVNVYLQEIIEEVGLEPITVHGLRHTFCTWLLRNGVPVKDVSDTVGHSKPSVTLNLYWQSIPGVGARVSAKVTELLSPGSPAVVEIGEKLVKSPGETA